MKALCNRLPAWLLNQMPVRFARQAIGEGARTGQLNQTSEVALTENAIRQLLVDVSVIYRSDARTGIQRVVRALLLQLLASPPSGYEVRPVYAALRHGYRFANPEFLTHPHVVTDTADLDSVIAGNGDIFLGLDLAAHLLPRHSSQVLQWKRAGVKIHVLVYDLLPLQHPEWFNPKTTRNFTRWAKWIGTYADNTICISETVRADLANWLSTRFALHHNALPSSSITLGADISNTAPSQGITPTAARVLERLRTSPSLLMVGTLEPRKGHDQVLAAVNALQQRSESASPLAQIILVIVGRPGWKTDALQRHLRANPQAGKQVIWFDQASDDLLVKLYAACSAVIVASRGEGFGLPLVEAALHGKPIVARDLPAFRELDIPNVTFFSGETPGVLADAMQASLGAKQGTTNALHVAYTWARSAGQLLEALTLESASARRARV